MSELKICHKHISNDLCNQPILNDVYVINEQSIPKRIGVYVITHTHDNIHAERYVGVTKNLYRRICHHSNKEIIYIDLYITDDIDLAESLERILMELIKPATNRRFTPLSDKDKEIMKELLCDDILRNYISDNKIKIGCRYLKYIVNGEDYNNWIDKKDFIKQRKINKEEDYIRPRKIGLINCETPYITLPNFFGKKGQYVNIEYINDKEIKVRLIN